jgi:alpha-galactosidase
MSRLRLTKFAAPLLVTMALFRVAPAVSFSTSSEEDAARQWTAAKFLGEVPAEPREAYLLVHNASDSVLRNGIKGHPFRIVNTEYRRGINLPMVGTVIVHLPRPGRSFEAVVGVDSNDVGYYSNAGKGSVVATVELGGKGVFQTAVMHEGMAGVPLKLELGGASEFTLQTKRIGERNPWDEAGWDQVDWADARVTLEDGSSLWLADLPMGPLPASYSIEPPFSFRYGGRPSSELLKSWDLKRSRRDLDSNRTEYTVVYRDSQTGLAVRSVAIAYHDFPTVEWTLYLRNESSEESPIIENVEALDTRFERTSEGEFLLHHNKGSQALATDYQPFQTPLPPKTSQHLSAVGGRPTNTDLCYFNLEWSQQGVIIALGWPGQWAADFARDDARGVNIRAGQELTHFKLLPGEEVRGPLVALQFWRGDWIGAQNVWRRWMIAHNLPRPNGKLPPPESAAGSGRFTIEMQGANEANQKHYLDLFLEKGFRPDYWWMDAGWYIFKSHWYETGTWEVDPARFPRGLRAIDDYAHSKGVKTIVWFEPERVAPGSWLYEKHPEWLLGVEGKDKLLNLGNPEAWHWLVEHVDGILKEQAIDLYRQDFNFDPLPMWRAADAPDRQGITEIRHVTGYLAYWDELRRRHPGMLIDSCASGGRRNDLETLRRAVPLWRSDYPYDPEAMQNQTYGLAMWVPYFGTAINADDAYGFRSQMTPAVAVGILPDSKGIDYGQYLHLTAQWREVSPYYYGDYYPLTDYRTEDDAWTAWQFDVPATGEGMIQAFRRPKSPFESARLKLRGLDPNARYRLTDLDRLHTTEVAGSELTLTGLPVTINAQPGAALIKYKKVEPGR